MSAATSESDCRASTTVLPYLNSAQAVQPSFGLNVEQLREMDGLIGSSDPAARRGRGRGGSVLLEEALGTAQAQIVRAASYGVSRFGPRKRKLAWRMESRPSSTISTRPRPMPRPPWGGHPYRNAFK